MGVIISLKKFVNLKHYQRMCLERSIEEPLSSIYGRNTEKQSGLTAIPDQSHLAFPTQ